MSRAQEQLRLEEFTQVLKTKVSVDTDGAFTVKELATATGRGDNWVRESLRAALAIGAWEVVRIKRMNMTGRMQVTPGYQPVSPKLVSRKRSVSRKRKRTKRTK